MIGSMKQDELKSKPNNLKEYLEKKNGKKVDLKNFAEV